jgi:hypothetical protein
MKKIANFQIFEAFKSQKLTKTLGFINAGAKTKFLEQLKNLGEKIDFPISEYSDDYFQYLPFQKALNLNRSVIDEVCDATSQAEFPEYVVPGSTCNGSGRLDRKWGRSTRSVVCPVCSGSGIKPKRDFELKWIKFWFDKDGNYVNMTGTDGKIRTQRTDKETYFDGDTNWSEDPNDYVKLRNLTRDELVNLPTGAYVLGNFDRGVIVARTYKSSSEPRKIYIIQNNQDGSEPNDNLWQRFGRFSWVVTQTGNEMSGNATLLIPKLKYEDIKRNDDQTEVNPYDWNNFLNVRHLRLDSDTDVKERIKDAHFAIVLDWLELKKSTFKPKEETSLQRASQRRGAIALKSDEEIKKANLNRYIEQITKNLEVKSDFGNMRTIISRFFGYEMAGWFILKGRKFDEFENFLNHLFRFLKNGNEQHYNYCIRYYKDSMQSNIGYISELKKTLDSVRNQSKTFQDGRLSECYQKLEELADLVKTNVNQFKIETYEDLETFYQSIKSVRELMYSDRYKLRNVYRALENIRVGEPRTFYYYFEDIDEPKETAEDLDRYKAFVNRMLK